MKMALSSNAKSRSLLGKLLPGKGESSSRKSGPKKKNSQQRELKLEAFSVSQNFDPETYVIPLQNRWTVESDGYSKIGTSSTFDDTIENDKSIDDLIIKPVRPKSKQKHATNGKIVTAQIFENPAKDDKPRSRKFSTPVTKKESIKLLKKLDGINGIGYVPSHPRLKQRHSDHTVADEDGQIKINDDIRSSFQDSWKVELDSSTSERPSGCSSRNRSIHPPNYDETERIIKNDIIPIDKISAVPGMVEKNPDHRIDDYSDLDIDRVELIAESDDYEYDDYDDRWSVDTPSLPPLSLSSSEESVNRDFDQSSQSEFSTMAYRRNSRFAVRKSTELAIDKDDVQPEFLAELNELQRVYQSLALDLDDQRKHMLRKNDISDRKEKKMKKQRAKELKLMDQRFTRLESHVITLARSVAHLSAELKSQNAIRQHVASLQKDVYDVKSRRKNELAYLQERVQLVQTDKRSQKTIRKLRRFFGEDPGHPLLHNLLEELGYEQYSRIFLKAKVGIMELPYMSEEQLKEIGIPAGPRRRILENVKHLY